MPTHRISNLKWNIVTPSFQTEGRMKFYHEASKAMPREFNRGSANAQPEAVTRKRDNTMNNSPSNKLHAGKHIDISSTKEFKFPELAMLSITPIVRSIHHWWLQRAERHYLICADVEQQRAREAQMNVAYYQKRAALARSARL